MKAFGKTLFGDSYNLAAVSCVLAVGGLANGTGHPNWAVLAMPAAALGAVAWLVRH